MNEREFDVSTGFICSDDKPHTGNFILTLLSSSGGMFLWLGSCQFVSEKCCVITGMCVGLVKAVLTCVCVRACVFLMTHR